MKIPFPSPDLHRPALADLPTSDEIWEVGVFEIDSLLDHQVDFGPGHSVVMVASREGPLPVGTSVVGGEQRLQAVVTALVETCYEPSYDAPRLPAALVVASAELAAALAERFQETRVRVVSENELPAAWRLARECLEAVLPRGPEGDYGDAGVPEPTGRRLFEAARAFFLAAPWQVLDDSRPLELRLPDGPEPCYAVVMGAGGITRGLAIFADRATLEAMYAGPEDGIGSSLSLTYNDRSDAPRPLVDEARRHGWKLAGPQAFPIALYSAGFDGSAGGPEGRYVDAGEAEQLVLAMRSVAGFCRRHQRELRRGETVETLAAVETAGGEKVLVGLRTLEVERDDDRGRDVDPSAFPGRSEADAGSAPGAGYLPELDVLRALVTRVKGGQALVRRLRWSFFRSEFPFYALPDDEDVERAHIRFLEWALFAARIWPDGRTIAQRAIDAATDLPDAERRRLHAIAQPRYGAYVIEEVELDVGMRLHDSIADESFRVREGIGTHQIEAGNLLIGPILPDGDGQWVLSPAMTVLPELPADLRLAAGRLSQADSDFALAIEEALFGATSDWIQEVETPRELRQEYEGFVAALGGKRSGLPTLAALQKRVRAFDSPVEVLQVADGFEWWSLEEAKVFVGFLQRLWNVTPRPELGDRSPDQVVRGEPPRPRPRGDGGGAGKRGTGRSRKRRR